MLSSAGGEADGLGEVEKRGILLSLQLILGAGLNGALYLLAHKVQAGLREVQVRLHRRACAGDFLHLEHLRAVARVFQAGHPRFHDQLADFLVGVVQLALCLGDSRRRAQSSDLCRRVRAQPASGV